MHTVTHLATFTPLHSPPSPPTQASTSVTPLAGEDAQGAILQILDVKQIMSGAQTRYRYVASAGWRWRWLSGGGGGKLYAATSPGRRCSGWRPPTVPLCILSLTCSVMLSDGRHHATSMLASMLSSVRLCAGLGEAVPVTAAPHSCLHARPAILPIDAARCQQ